MLPERQKQCKVLTLKGRCRSPDDPRCSPTVGSSVPFAVTWLPAAENSEREGDLLHLSAAGLSKKDFTAFKHSSSCDNPERWAFGNWALRAKEGPPQPLHWHLPSPAGPLRRATCTSERRSENSRRNGSRRIAGARELPGAQSPARCQPSAQQKQSLLLSLAQRAAQAKPSQCQLPSEAAGTRRALSCCLKAQQPALGGRPKCLCDTKARRNFWRSQYRDAQKTHRSGRPEIHQTYSVSSGSAPLSSPAAGLGCWTKCWHVGECWLLQTAPVQRHVERQSARQERAGTRKDCPSERWLAQIPHRAHGKRKAVGHRQASLAGGVLHVPFSKATGKPQRLLCCSSTWPGSCYILSIFCKTTATRY